MQLSSASQMPASSKKTQSQRTAAAGSFSSILSTSWPEINDLTAYQEQNPGKRIRANIAGSIAEHVSINSPKLEMVIEILESLQSATLVHDDIVDHSEIRRGQPTLWQRYSPEIALLYGDLMYARVIQAISEIKDLPVGRSTQLVECFATASARVQEGQLLETLHAFDTQMSSDLYIQIARLKTASLIELAASIPFVLCAHSYNKWDEISGFADAFGCAFQIYNDLTDISSEFGKDSFADLRQGRVTLPLIFHFESAPVHDSILTAYSRRATDKLQSCDVSGLLAESGALQASDREMNKYIERAKICAQTAFGGVPSYVLEILAHFANVSQVLKKG